ncbi:hypothetical protein Tsubulata_001165 [Turnera subulata]|uniref:CCHC-type domain-containing protein n=1 Tax=Turnera subulata TaxID=218843 RepID=A0A9Q0JRG1_9ROSI|nr:hypothetical protein Tsubulata_001165 [Turnera subulata]
MTQPPTPLPTLKLIENVRRGRTFRTLVLAGRVLSDYPVLLNTVNSIVQKVWSPRKALHVKEVNSNTFLFSFEEARDRLKALRGGPWSLNGNHLVLKEWPVGLALDDINFSSSDFWVHVHGLLPEQLEESNAQCIAECVGIFLEMDLSVDSGVCHNDVMRIKVRLDTQKPLMPGITNTRPDSSSMWLRLWYERLPRFCMQCGRMGHLKQICSFNGTGWYGVDREPYEANKFGPWMCADHNPSKIKIPTPDLVHREVEGAFGSPRRGRSLPPSPRAARGAWARGNGRWALF